MSTIANSIRLNSSYRGVPFALNTKDMPRISPATEHVFSTLNIRLPSQKIDFGYVTVSQVEHASMELIQIKENFVCQQMFDAFRAFAVFGGGAMVITLILTACFNPIILTTTTIGGLIFMTLSYFLLTIDRGYSFAETWVEQQEMLPPTKRHNDIMRFASIFWICFTVLCPLVIACYPYIEKHGWQKIIDSQTMDVRALWKKNKEWISTTAQFYIERYDELYQALKCYSGPLAGDIPAALAEVYAAHAFYSQNPLKHKIHSAIMETDALLPPLNQIVAAYV